MAGSDLIAETDILVIGAGVMGASIAFQLSRQTEQRVLVIDQAPPLSGMSGRTFGQVRLHYSNALMLQLAKRGFDIFDNWSDAVGYGHSGYVPMGYMLIVKENHLDALQRNIELAQSLDIDTRFVDRQEIKALEPAIHTDDLVGGAYDPAGGYIDVTRIVLSWLSSIQERGVRVMTGACAQAIETANGRISGVRTSAGRIDASVVISATGSWSRELLSPLGIDLPLEIRRLDMMYMRQPPNRAQIGLCVTDGNSNVVIRPDMGRDFLISAYPPEMPEAKTPDESNDRLDDPEHLARIERALTERLPDFCDASPVRPLSGTYDITPDWHPIVGWADGIDGLFLAAGFSGHGLKLAPAIGEAVAAMVLDKTAPIDIHPLRLQRFADGEPMYLAYGPGARG